MQPTAASRKKVTYVSPDTPAAWLNSADRVTLPRKNMGHPNTKQQHRPFFVHAHTAQTKRGLTETRRRGRRRKGRRGKRGQPRYPRRRGYHHSSLSPPSGPLVRLFQVGRKEHVSARRQPVRAFRRIRVVLLPSNRFVE